MMYLSMLLGAIIVLRFFIYNEVSEIKHRLDSR